MGVGRASGGGSGEGVGLSHPEVSLVCNNELDCPRLLVRKGSLACYLRRCARGVVALFFLDLHLSYCFPSVRN